MISTQKFPGEWAELPKLIRKVPSPKVTYGKPATQDAQETDVAFKLCLTQQTKIKDKDSF